VHFATAVVELLFANLLFRFAALEEQNGLVIRVDKGKIR
jgi:hypothetical protein